MNAVGRPIVEMPSRREDRMRYRQTPFIIVLAAIATLATDRVATSSFDPGSGSSKAATLERSPLVVHEWGTFTSIAGEDELAVDWVPQAGPDDLPCFVERSRLAPESSPTQKPPLTKFSLSGTVRMETPVLYFYASEETTVTVAVRFRQGLITEWFPQARVTPESPNGQLPFDPTFEGSIEWRDVRIRPDITGDFPVEPGASHYYAARRTDASPVQVGPDQEKFLFYRGVSRFPVPLLATLDNDGRIVVRHREGQALGTLLLFQRHGGSTSFQLREESSAQVTFDFSATQTPDLKVGPTAHGGGPTTHGNGPALPLAQLEQRLVANGLYPKEAKSMVDTWRDSWFEDGVRLIYIVPPPVVDAILPLDITPRPTSIARVFVGRIELFTPSILKEVEQALVVSDRATLQKYGRFMLPIGQRLVSRSEGNQRAQLERSLQALSAVSLSPTRCASER